MKRELRDKIYTTLNNLNDELDNSYELKSRLNRDTQLGELVCNETRIKLLRDYINIFKCIKQGKSVIEMTTPVAKRNKLHFYQLRKLGTKNYEDNERYFKTLMCVVLSLEFSLIK
jgi:hypothetical protein